jgi:hypothetical protein
MDKFRCQFLKQKLGDESLEGFYFLFIFLSLKGVFFF